MTQTIEHAIQAASQCLEGVGIENPRLESEFLMAAFLQLPRTRLILDRHQVLSRLDIERFQEWLRERQMRKPLAYVTGEQPFRDLNLMVSPSVLVPRPETELLVEQAFRCLEETPTAVTAIDVGTGSGNIALSLAAHPKIHRMIAIDRSPAALKMARSNENKMGRGVRVEWIRGDLLTSLVKARIHAELIVANLPYVRTSDLDDLEPELHWEPSVALDGGADGLRLIEPCIEQASDVLRAEGILLLEIGAEQLRPVAALLDQSGRWTDIKLFRDLAGLPRIIQAKRMEV